MIEFQETILPYFARITKFIYLFAAAKSRFWNSYTRM